MATQTENGKAFEWAMALAVHEISNFPIVSSPASTTAQEKYRLISDKKRDEFSIAARLSVEHIWEKEKHRLGDVGHITLASDVEGQTGDVIDVLITGKATIGISCKTNHDALKHSRLSSSIDFVKKWGLESTGCSKEYWDSIRPLFTELQKIRQSSNHTTLWSELTDVPGNYYWPILDAFATEILRLQNQNIAGNNLLCKQLFLYLVGNQDFYKVMSHTGKVEIQAFNFNGNLSVPKMKIPEKIITIDNQNGGQYSKTIRFTNGYTINFRIHNASSRVEASLKFDIRMLGVDPHGYRNTIETK